ncbi:hypothetical protein [Ekhidna sp.]|uniref:hypothetical protein n=1 Tax=Ekhidna sp. TaxID=2608089 RepID=UPI003B5B067B
MQLAKILPLFCLLLACEQQKNFALRTSVDFGIVKVDTLSLIENIEGNKFNYQIGDHQFDYIIDFSNLSNSSYFINSEEQTFGLDDTVSTFLNTRKIKIYRFNSNPEIYDGEQFHFFTAEHGLLMIRNPTWGNSTILELWSYPILEQMDIFRTEQTELSESDLEFLNGMNIETTEN